MVTAATAAPAGGASSTARASALLMPPRGALLMASRTPPPDVLWTSPVAAAAANAGFRGRCTAAARRPVSVERPAKPAYRGGRYGGGGYYCPRRRWWQCRLPDMREGAHRQLRYSCSCSSSSGLGARAIGAAPELRPGVTLPRSQPSTPLGCVRPQDALLLPRLLLLRFCARSAFSLLQNYFRTTMVSWERPVSVCKISITFTSALQLQGIPINSRVRAVRQLKCADRTSNVRCLLILQGLFIP